MSKQTTAGDNQTAPKSSSDPLATLKSLKETADKLWREWSEKHKNANILIVGKTGVGKSTLINAVFRENLAETGIGRPVTQGIHEVSEAVWEIGGRGCHRRICVI